MLYLAYDGTSHGDWVARYAIRLAANSPDRQLHVVCIAVDANHSARSRDPFEQLERECVRQQVTMLRTLDVDSHDAIQGVAERLNARLPVGPDVHLICGTRARLHGRGLLSGSVAQSLLARGNRNVLALHVVHPGLLGEPRDVLIPVSGHPRGLRLAVPWLRRFGPTVRRLHLLHVAGPPRDWWRMATVDDLERALAPSHDYLRRIESELAAVVELRDAIVDVTVLAGRDVPREIINHANRTRSRLIFLGASQRSLSQRLWAGNPVERILATAPCDVAIYRGVE